MPGFAGRPSAACPVAPRGVSAFGLLLGLGHGLLLRLQVVGRILGHHVVADRLGFFGTSQGGGTSLLLASILGPEIVRAVAADVPFLTDFVYAPVDEHHEGPYAMVGKGVVEHFADNEDYQRRAWRALGYVDTISHAHRLTQPVLLTAGGADPICPSATIEKLFNLLPGTRSYTHLSEQEHGYTPAFLRLAAAWFDTWL